MKALNVRKLFNEPRDGLVMEASSLFALAALLTLVQLPHVLNLPLWVSAFGLSIIALRVYARRSPNTKYWRHIFSTTTITALAVLGAVLIRAHYGYFFGRDPCVAFLFILVSLKFAEYRRSADATLLLGLSCILLLTQYFYSQSLIAALVTVPAVFALGHALAVLRDPKHALAQRPQIKLVGKLLLQGLPIAALLFVLFPRLPGPLWSLPDDAAGKTGLSDSMSPGDIGVLSQSSEVAFRVEFNDTPPAKNELYWRGPVLSLYDGFVWRPAQNTVEMRPANNSAFSIEYTVTLQPHQQHWLFALEQTASIPKRSGDIHSTAAASEFTKLTSTGQLMARRPVKRVLRYTQRSNLGDRFFSPILPTQAELFVPVNMPRTKALADKLIAQSSSAEDYAARVLRRFSEQNYRYTLQPGLLGDSPVDEFLFDTQAGFCEHYSSAFTLLMRAAGIPARVVTGYLGGEMNDDYMIVRQSDAHAWSEVYINGAWQRFDPTAAVAPSRVEQNVRQALPSGELSSFRDSTAFSWTKSLALAWDSVNHDWQRLVIDFNNRSQEDLFKKLGLPSFELWQIVAIVLALSAIWSAWLLRRPLSPRKQKLSPADRAWKELENFLKEQGLEREKSEAPHAYLDRACPPDENQTGELRNLGQLLLRARFGPVPESVAAEQAHAASIALKRFKRRSKN